MFSDEIVKSREAYLEHHGIKGQRWGIRRDPERLGKMSSRKMERVKIKALRDAGKVEIKRSKIKAKNEAKVNKTRQKIEDKIRNNREKYLGKTKNDRDDKTKKIDLSKLSDDELQTRIDRLTLERKYEELKPKEPTKPPRFMKEFREKAIKPAVLDAGKDIISKTLKAYGLDLLGVEVKKDIGPVLKKASKMTHEETKKEKEKDTAAYKEKESREEQLERATKKRIENAKKAREEKQQEERYNRWIEKSEKRAERDEERSRKLKEAANRDSSLEISALEKKWAEKAARKKRNSS